MLEGARTGVGKHPFDGSARWSPRVKKVYRDTDRNTLAVSRQGSAGRLRISNRALESLFGVFSASDSFPWRTLADPWDVSSSNVLCRFPPCWLWWNSRCWRGCAWRCSSSPDPSPCRSVGSCWRWSCRWSSESCAWMARSTPPGQSPPRRSLRGCATLCIRVLLRLADSPRCFESLWLRRDTPSSFCSFHQWTLTRSQPLRW